jgi:hypothetical protein
MFSLSCHRCEAANRYVKQHINDIVKLPVDLNCLSSPMLKKLASLLTVQVTQALRALNPLPIVHVCWFCRSWKRLMTRATVSAAR